MDMIVGVSDCISLALHHYLWLLEGAVTVWWPRSSWSFWGGRPFRLCPYLVLHLWMWIKCGDNFNYRFFWHAAGALAAARSHFHLEIIKTTARLRMGKGFQLSGTFDWLRLGTKSAERNCDFEDSDSSSSTWFNASGKMLQEKAIGVLVDGNSSLQSTAGTSILGRLFTREDGFNIHKLFLGFVRMCDVHLQLQRSRIDWWTLNKGQNQKWLFIQDLTSKQDWCVCIISSYFFIIVFL